jgi:hypothetical protein
MMISDNIAINRNRDMASQSLMTWAQAGDSKVYRRLLEEVAHLLRSLGGYLENDQHDAELVLRDILLTLHVLRHTYDSSRPFEPWLTSIASHRARHYRAITKENSNAQARADTGNDRDSDDRFGSGSSLASAYATKTMPLRERWKDYVVAKRNIGSIWTHLSKIQLISLGICSRLAVANSLIGEEHRG